jgi:hypothetical protein
VELEVRELPIEESRDGLGSGTGCHRLHSYRQHLPPGKDPVNARYFAQGQNLQCISCSRPPEERQRGPASAGPTRRVPPWVSERSWQRPEGDPSDVRRDLRTPLSHATFPRWVHGR